MPSKNLSRKKTQTSFVPGSRPWMSTKSKFTLRTCHYHATLTDSYTHNVPAHIMRTPTNVCEHCNALLLLMQGSDILWMSAYTLKSQRERMVLATRQLNAQRSHKTKTLMSPTRPNYLERNKTMQSSHCSFQNLKPSRESRWSVPEPPPSPRENRLNTTR